MKDIQQEIQKALNNVVEKGCERGLQLAVYYQGELILDAWAGIADHQTGRPVDGTTLFPVFSTTKGIAATLLHIISERKQLNYDVAIREIWPEFGVNGKEKCTLRQALNHTSGIPHMPLGLGPENIMNWDKMCDEIAKLTPQWTPGEHLEYHAITFG